MSSAFTRENDDVASTEDIVPRPVSPHRNLVTPNGLAQIDKALEAAKAAFGEAERALDRRAIALAVRDMNYWSARRANAELVEPIKDVDEARFGHEVSVATKSGKTYVFRIVGEDEADPAHGLIPHVAPLAKALLGKSVGDRVEVMHEKGEITRIAV
jgi:transcription elongation GreA/GreB family factor